MEAPARLWLVEWSADATGALALDAEYVYALSARQGSQILNADEGGMVDLLALDDTTLFALEREWIGGAPRTNTRPKALYEINTTNADDVAEIGPLAGDAQTVTKRRVLDLKTVRAAGHIERVGSFEPMIFGPDLDDGRRTLILVEDNDDGVDTQIVAFALRMN